MKPVYLLAAVMLSFGTASNAWAACGDPAGPGVDWNNCDKSEVNLSGKEMSGANLFSVNLTWANLSGARLRGADLGSTTLMEANLSGADLTYATLTAADLTRVNLSGATWVDGRVCDQGSIGVCNIDGVAQ